jgi:hypothetical protein
MDPVPDTGESPASPPQVPPDRKKLAQTIFVLLMAAVLAAALLPGLLVQPPQGGIGEISTTISATTIAPPVHRTPVRTPPGTPGATPSATPSPTATQTYSGPPGFTVTITPPQATAGRGETVTYTMLIEAQNGFDGQIHMVVTAGFLFFSQSQDLGYQSPPYPKTIEYPFTVPDTLPPGVTVNGVVTSTGGGITREDHLSLTVR